MANILTRPSHALVGWPARFGGLEAPVAYACIGAIVTLYVFSPSLTRAMAAGLVLAVALLWVRPRPLRDFRAWLAALGIQFNQSVLDAAWRPALSDLLFLPLALGLAARWWRGGRRPPRAALLPWMAGLAIAVCGSGTVMARVVLGYVPTRTWLAKDIGLLVLIAGYLAVVTIGVSRRRTREIVAILLLSGFALQSLALAVYAANSFTGVRTQFLWEADSPRLTGLLVNPTAEGGILFSLLLLQLAIVGAGHRLLPGKLDWVNAALLFIALVLTFSRSAWLAAAAGLIVLTGLQLIQRRRGAARLPLAWLAAATPPAMAATLAALLLPALINAASGQVWARIAARPADSIRIAANLMPDQEASASAGAAEAPPSASSATPAPPVATQPPGQDTADTRPPPSTAGERASFLLATYVGNSQGIEARLGINRLALDLFTESPLTIALGAGVGSFLARSPEIGLSEGLVIHNTYLWILVETGIVGFIALAGLLGRALWIGVHAVGRGAGLERALAVGALSATAAMMVWMLANEVLYQRHLWVLLGLVDVLYQLSSAERRRAVNATKPREDPRPGSPTVAIPHGRRLPVGHTPG